MAAAVNDRIALLHVPKTGGTWACHAIIEAGVHVREPEVVAPDLHYAQKGHVRLDQIPGFEELFTIAFVRHPLDWWRSFWAHRMREGWLFPDHEIDSRAASEDFDDFVEQVLRNLPGFCGELFERFTGPARAPVSFTGRYEHLVDDLCFALRVAGQPFDEPKLRGFPPRNVGDDRWLAAAQYRPEHARRLARAERAAIRRWYEPRRTTLRLPLRRRASEGIPLRSAA
jgi:hypothetical protein